MKDSIWNYIDEKSKKALFFIGLYIISGGFYGLFIVLENFRFEPISVGVLTILVGLIFIFTIYTGYLLIKKRNLGLDFAKVVMALQVLGLKVLGYKYFFYLGIAFGIQHNWEDEGVTNLIFNMNLVNFDISLVYDEYGEVGVFINILPILMIRYFLKIESKAIEQRILTKLD